MAAPSSQADNLDATPRRGGTTGWMLPLTVIFVLAHALQLTRLGLAWDDWPIIFLSNMEGPGVMMAHTAQDRPLQGPFYTAAAALCGNRLWAWHLNSLLLRLGTGLLFAGVLRRLRHPAGDFPVMGMVLFVLYPGFSQYALAVVYHMHFLALLAFTCSLYLTVKRARGESRFPPVNDLVTALLAA